MPTLHLYLCMYNFAEPLQKALMSYTYNLDKTRDVQT